MVSHEIPVKNVKIELQLAEGHREKKFVVNTIVAPKLVYIMN